ncbi:hypothetical protein QK908_04610 [Lactococcus cremoris]
MQFTTFSITEKGYSLRDSKDQLTPLALEDMQGRSKPKTNMGAITYSFMQDLKLVNFRLPWSVQIIFQKMV